MKDILKNIEQAAKYSDEAYENVGQGYLITDLKNFYKMNSEAFKSILTILEKIDNVCEWVIRTDDGKYLRFEDGTKVVYGSLIEALNDCGDKEKVEILAVI